MVECLIRTCKTNVPGAAGSKVLSGQLNNVILNPSITDLLNDRNSRNYISSKPKAYLNWILLDEQFNEVLTNDGKNSGFEQVGGDKIFTPHTRSGIELTKNGYLYVSNESTDINVFFDNLQVTHIRGPLLEEMHYYPFGLTMSGISSKAAGGLENKKGYNGNELQNKEFSDGSGLEMYDFNARTYDQQTGRFIQIDPTPDDGDQESLSPYHFSKNNPIRYNDPDGKCPSCVIGGIVGFAVDGIVQVGSSLTRSIANGEAPSMNTVWRDYSGVQGAGAFGAGFVTQGLSAYEEGAAAVVKTVAVNATFSAATQLGTDGKIDLMKTAIDAAPIPEYKGASLINTNDAQKAVRSAENSIKSSTSAIPERKVNQLNQATNNLKNQKIVNTTIKNSVSSLREGTTKEIANGVNKGLSNPSTKVSPINISSVVHYGSDATVVKPPILFK